MHHAPADAHRRYPATRTTSRVQRGWRGLVVTLATITVLLLSSTNASALTAGLGLMWTVLPSAPVRLVVCWENPAYADPLPGESDLSSGAQRREWVRLALKRTWERESRVLFVGWQQCQNEESPTAPPHTLGPRRPGTADENVKIQITNYGGGMNPGHGSWGDYEKPGVLLNLHYASQAWYEAVAIHEFGHVLGLYHEEERSDWPTDIAGCPPQTWPPSDPWWPIPTELRWGAPDRDSVMAYCSGGPNVLSPHDVAGIQRAYMRHIPGTLLSLPGALCLSAHANAANGANAFGWACDEANDDQEWRYNPATSALYVQWPADPAHTPRCLDVDTNNYSDVQIWDCLNGSNQQWTFRNTTLRGYGGLCLTRPVAGAGPLTMETCTGADSQLWRLDSGQVPGRVRLRSNTGDLCLAQDGASGSNALAAPCPSKRVYLPLLQRSASHLGFAYAPSSAAVASPIAATGRVWDFVLYPGGTIGVPDPAPDGLCLDVQDVANSDYVAGIGGPAAGQRVQFFTCLIPQLNQRWSLSGDLVSGNKCLTLGGNGVSDGNAALVATCNGTARQDWEYHW